MIPKPVVLGLLVAASVTAAAGGAYVAVRHNEADRPAPIQTAPDAKPVAETEAVVSPTGPAVEPEPEPAPAPVKEQPIAREGADRAPRRTSRTEQASRPAPPARSSTVPAAKPATSEPSEAPRAETPLPEQPAAGRDTGAAAPTTPVPAPPEPLPEPPPPARPQFVEVVVPEASVVGLRVATSLSSETARIEDRVEARVTRDVMADGQLAIPAGSRVLGDVVTVERGGKMKDRARLGVRFHTLVLADGRHVPFRTDSIFREGSSPGAESARKIGGAAIGGAVLGAIIGGAKGAAIGGATGAAGGSAVVMAGDRNAATLAAGTIVTVRLTSPVTISVERES